MASHFLYNGANGPESRTTLYFEEVRQVAVPFGRQTTHCLVLLSYIKMRHRNSIELEFHEADTNADIFAMILAKNSTKISVSVSILALALALHMLLFVPPSLPPLYLCSFAYLGGQFNERKASLTAFQR